MFNIIEVNSRAEQALVKNLSNPEESRQIYLEEILDWTDNYTENKLNLSSTHEAKDALSNIVKLWIAFCTMEITLRQFKQAVKIFEDAISDPVASRSADIYLAYVDYCKTRGKLANAQKVYIKGLSSSLAQDEADKLWLSFLPFIRSQGSPELTMTQLYEAVRCEAGIDSLTPPGLAATTTAQVVETSAVDSSADTILASQLDSTPNSNNSNTSQNLVDVDASSRMVLEESYTDAECKSDETTNFTPFGDSSFTESVDKAEGGIVKLEKITLSDFEDKMEVVDDVKLMIKSESSELAVSDVQTAASSASVVADTFVNPGGVGDDLDTVAGLTPEQLTRMYRHRPPMLFSAPNKEPTVFGLSPLSPSEVSELEAFLGASLTSVRYGERQIKVDTYLDLVEGLWTAQALKERHFDSWFTDLKKLHEKEGRDLTRACDDKEKEAAGTPTLESVKEKNQVDLKRFRSRSAVQREVLHSVVNKTIYSLLMDQQQALVAAEFPRFNPSVVERMQLAMAALRTGVGAAGSGTPATANHPASNFDSALLDELAGQKKLLCALLSLRVNLTPNPSHRSGGAGRRDGLDGGTYPVMRGSSVGSDYRAGGRDSRADYYSQDAKQQRKAKRRKVYPAEGGDEIRFDDRRLRTDNGPHDSRGFDGRRQGGQGQGQGGYQGSDNSRRGPARRGGAIGAGRGPAARIAGGENNSQQLNNVPQNQKSISTPSGAATVVTVPNNGEDPAPLTLLQKLATMIQNVKK